MPTVVSDIALPIIIQRGGIIEMTMGALPKLIEGGVDDTFERQGITDHA
jgi:hypothetical protein